MARLNEILVGRFNRGLQKLFGIKGDPPVATLAPELMPVHGIFNGIENRYLEGWNRFAMSANVTAVAANTSGIRFRNPTTSNVIAVFEKVTFIAAASQQVTVNNGPATTDLASPFSLAASRVDPRGNPTPSLIASTQNTTPTIPSLGNILWGGIILGNTSVDEILFEDQEIPLLPGDAIEFYENAVNTNLSVSFMWRERFLEDSERA